MSKFTVDNLIRVLMECAGEGEEVNIGTDIGAISFGELGYDSLALMEAASQVERELGVDLPDDIVGEISSPGEFIEIVNRRLGEVA